MILAYAGGTSNLFNDLEAKHPVTHTKVVPRECSTQKQTTLGMFATACPPARANRTTTLIRVMKRVKERAVKLMH